MYPRWRFSLKYLGHLIGSSNGHGHGTHSPFIFRYIRDVLRDKTAYTEYKAVEKLRRELSGDSSILEIDDLGAGSAISAKKNRTVASLARYAAKSPALGQLLFRMVKDSKPGYILEMGTSLGITTSYLAMGSPGGTVYTLEGAGEVAEKAQINLVQLGLNDVKLVRGNFDDTLPLVLNEIPRVDFFFLDGNHRKEPTLDYFRQLLPRMQNDSVMVFDDIHWSREMEEAWEIIKTHGSVRCTVDIFWMGIVFFRKEFHEKQHFRIRF